MKRIFLLSVLFLCACQGQIDETGRAPDRVITPPSPEELNNATYSGIDDSRVTLVNGEWRGEPYIEGGAARPSAGLAKSFSLRGDVDGDGIDEAVVLLWTSTGGSGTFDYIAVLGRDSNGDVVNIGTAALGDRVKVRSAEIVDGQLIFDVIQAGPNDAMCCPGQKVRRTFALKNSGLKEISSEDMGRVSPDPAIN